MLEFGKIPDVFYVGGTKNGLLSGEAVVFKDKEMCKDFRYHIKNKGAMLAKGFVLGIQFERLFKDDLYLEIGKNANVIAQYLTENLIKLVNIDESDTNQVFATFPKNKALDIIDKFGCELWEDFGDSIKIRFVTSYRTKKEDVNQLINYLKDEI